MKRLLSSLTLLLTLGAAAQGLAQPAPLPDDPRFSQAVEFRTGPSGELLSEMIEALAESVGLTVIVKDIPDVTISYDIGDPKPFRQVWDLVLTLNNLDYALLDNDVMVVGPPAAIAGVQRGGQLPSAAQADQSQRLFPVSSNPEELAQVVRQTVPGVSVSVLSNLNTLMVRGTEEQLDEVAEVLGRFDVEVAAAVRRVYFLSNQDATALAATLQQTVVAGMTGASAGAQPGGQPAVRAADISITPEPTTNSIIVTAPEAVQSQIAGLIKDLDIPQPQVNVQVRIQEINSRTAQDLGIDLNAGLGNFAATILDGGLSFIFDTATSVSGLNLNAVLDTLEQQDLSRRVDDTTITMLNNGTGIMKSGGRIELTIPGPDGNIERTIEFGVIIEVTPRISSDGRVILDVNAEVSDLVVPLDQGGIPSRIDFSEREVSSTVTLAPGQTVLLGGMFQNQFTNTVDRVPILGSIPVIGALFSDTRIEEENSELLLIVTANVIE